jgi:hypothetical protein
MKTENALLIIILSILLAFVSSIAKADCNKVYAKVGAGYKFIESTRFTVNNVSYPTDYHSPYSARFELAIDCTNFTYGIAHHSQWLEGWPVNNHDEYEKTEIFIDFKYEFDI